MGHYLSECEHTFNILEIERNNTPYKGKHYKHMQYKIALASTVTREKETPRSKLRLKVAVFTLYNFELEHLIQHCVNQHLLNVK